MDNNGFCKASDLQNESDVEHKLLAQLLLTPKPIGLDYVVSEFRTKPDIRKVLIDKGKSEKLYYPDYVIIFSGLPLLIIEAKAPNEDLEEALRQARLYANELNKFFPRNINPCQKIIVSDGLCTICAYTDSDQDKFQVALQEMNISSPRYNDLLNFAGKETILKESISITKDIRGGAKFIKPKQLLGGKAVQNIGLKENSFGATLSFEFRNIFNPESKEERLDIVENAYVTTRRILRHVQPIEKIIRKSKAFGLDDIKQIEDTGSPVEIIEKLRKRDSLRNELILLVGNVGAGKSTFTDYLKEKALPEEIRKETVWITINLNPAPLNKEEIYRWLKENLIQKLIDSKPEIDFENKETLLKVYSSEFKALRKGPASFYEPGSQDYNRLFAEKLIELENNLDLKSKALVRFLCTGRSKLLVVALDNSDKRDAEKQLLMFDVATWLKEYFQCLVFLPLRDTTFNLYRKQKPLDTVIKDLVFKIDPPLLREVLIARVKYTLRILSKNKQVLVYELPNGMKVEYPQSEQGLYLASIVRSLFENAYFNRLISGIAGKDIRRGVEIFLDFCKSGHVDETEILKMKKFGAQYVLKNHLISRIVLRGSKRYYGGEESVIKNIFSSYPEEDTLPNPFTRYFILRWLFNAYYLEGPSRMRGFHMASVLIRELSTFGHDKERIKKEINTFISYGLIMTESQTEYLESETDLISISSYGIIHLDLIDDTNYLSAVAEDVYFREPNIATEIYKRISGKVGYGQFSYETILEISMYLINYLEEYSNYFVAKQASTSLSSENLESYYSFDQQRKKLQEFARGVDYFETIRVAVEHPPGKVIECEIVSTQPYGVFVEFGLEYSGMIHVSYFNKLGKYIEDYELGDKIEAQVLEYSEQHKRYNLKYLRDIVTDI